MKKNIYYLSVLSAFLLAGCSKDESLQKQKQGCLELCGTNGTTETPEGFTEQVIPGQYIVLMKSDLSVQSRMSDNMSYSERKAVISQESETILAENNISAEARQQVYAKALLGFSVRLNDAQLNQLKTDSRVAFIEQDKMITLVAAQGKPGGGGTTPPSQTTPWGVTRLGGAGDGTGKTAWIIDTGIDLDHPDLTVNVSKSKSFLGGTSTPDDQNGHGSHVSGTIAAKNNSIGAVGVAAGATVIAVRVLDRRGSGSISGVIAGVDYVAANAAAGDVANMSLGGGVSASLDTAVLNASNNGIWFALAAGNESDDANNHSPARINGAYIRTISAMDASDAFAYFSNYGTAVDYAAPGVNVYSCWKDGAYNTISGTSMATPHVAGLLLLSGGTLNTSGFVSGDPDGNPDPIAHR